MFDTLLKQYGGDPLGRKSATGAPDGWNYNIGQVNQSSGDTYVQNDPRSFYGINMSPEVAQSLGYTGQVEQTSGSGDMTATGTNPQFLQFLDQNGLREVQRKLDPYTTEHQFVDQNGNLVGQSWKQTYNPAGDLRALGTVAAAVGGGYLAAGAGGAGTAGAGGSAGGAVGGSAGSAGALAGGASSPAALAGEAIGAGSVGGTGAITGGSGLTATGGGLYSLGGSGASLGGAGAAAGGSSIGNWLSGLGSNLASGDVNTYANLLQSLGGYYASQKAADAQKGAVDQANAFLAPYRDAGTWAIGQQKNLLMDPSAITKDPSYQFGFDQGVRGYDQSATARGTRLSGDQAKALTRYGQNYAGSKLNDAFNRYGVIAGTGQTATGSTANNALMGGNASASGYVGGFNALMGGLNNYLRQQQEQELIRKYIGGGS